MDRELSGMACKESLTICIILRCMSILMRLARQCEKCRKGSRSPYCSPQVCLFYEIKRVAVEGKLLEVK